MKIGVILAGGKSSRFKSELPKGLHKIDGVTIVDRMIDCLKIAGIEKVYIVVNNENYHYYRKIQNVDFLFQGKLVGSGGAFYSFNGLFEEEDEIVVVNSDCVLFNKNIIKNFYNEFKNSALDLGIITSIEDNPSGLGRIYSNDKFLKIIEENECDEELKKIKEINTGVYLFKGDFLKSKMKYLNNKHKESKITNLFDYGGCYKYLCKDLIMSINNKQEFHDVCKKFYLYICYKHLNNGVKIYDINSTYIGENVIIGKDVEIYPNNYLYGETIIGDNCIVYPNCFINNSTIGDGCEIGPFSNLKNNCDIGKECCVGAYVEIKNSFLKDNVKAKHHAYLGDCYIGDNCNIGCGTIVANYNNKKQKNRTIIGKNTFIGSNVTLVAPVNVGNNVVVAAGSTITKDVDDYSLSIARSREINKKNYYH